MVVALFVVCVCNIKRISKKRIENIPSEEEFLGPKKRIGNIPSDEEFLGPEQNYDLLLATEWKRVPARGATKLHQSAMIELLSPRVKGKAVVEIGVGRWPITAYHLAKEAKSYTCLVWEGASKQEFGNCIKSGLNCTITRDFTALSVQEIPMADVYFFWVETHIINAFLKKFSEYANVVQRSFQILCAVGDLEDIENDTNKAGWHAKSALQQTFPKAHIKWEYAAVVQQDQFDMFHGSPHDKRFGRIWAVLIIDVKP